MLVDPEFSKFMYIADGLINNTSEVECTVLLSVLKAKSFANFHDVLQYDEDRFPNFKKVAFDFTVLQPGEM